ncbi:MAG: endonuclease III [Candidatus Competibacteraceae bacterium]|nr:endonuclease III [Candidatus Competibacteraceae bacterium]
MNRKQRYTYILKWFKENMPDAQTELQYSNAYELLVAVILSAQCTDKRVNLTTPDFFKQFPHAQALSRATPEQILPFIKSISYPNNKAKHLAGMAQKLVHDFNGEVPSDVDQLVTLPGVGRKTANVILSVVHNKPAMAVDTHVFRLSHRLGLVSATANTPEKVEKALLSYILMEDVARAHHWLILHGRYICKARNPLCDLCGLRQACVFAQKKVKSSDAKP